MRSLDFRVKICGVCSADDARAAVAAGVDAIGLNFYAQSPRHVTPEQAAEVALGARSARPQPRPPVVAGVFVNEPVASVKSIAGRVGLDILQIHGDEPPAYLAELARAVPLPVMRAFRLGAQGLPPVLDYLAQCRRLGCPPRWVLLDAHQPGSYGGTGKPADWSVAAQFPRGVDQPRIVLAGGLNPQNVAAAIAAAKPDGVDTASGVDSAPRRKDHALLRAFVASANAAFGQRP
ncbi:MAG: phosphoribosylanthranilate isomerase [Planctomycetia bacterium]|nr:phosphoribosylanthranilate isomerase [Planctomycetia bacterium]